MDNDIKLIRWNSLIRCFILSAIVLSLDNDIKLIYFKLKVLIFNYICLFAFSVKIPNFCCCFSKLFGFIRFCLIVYLGTFWIENEIFMCILALWILSWIFPSSSRITSILSIIFLMTIRLLHKDKYSDLIISHYYVVFLIKYFWFNKLKIENKYLKIGFLVFDILIQNYIFENILIKQFALKKEIFLIVFLIIQLMYLIYNNYCYNFTIFIGFGVNFVYNYGIFKDFGKLWGVYYFLIWIIGSFLFYRMGLFFLSNEKIKRSIKLTSKKLTSKKLTSKKKLRREVKKKKKCTL